MHVIILRLFRDIVSSWYIQDFVFLLPPKICHYFLLPPGITKLGGELEARDHIHGTCKNFWRYLKQTIMYWRSRIFDIPLCFQYWSVSFREISEYTSFVTLLLPQLGGELEARDRIRITYKNFWRYLKKSIMYWRSRILDIPLFFQYWSVAFRTIFSNNQKYRVIGNVLLPKLGGELETRDRIRITYKNFWRYLQ